MILFESITLQQFALFPSLTIPLSVDKGQPLTVIRGENGAGKTTLMRAFVWGLFGKDALQHVADARHPVRPVWGQPGEVIRTKVDVKFRAESDRSTGYFKLSRSVSTTDNGQIVEYGEETVRLLKRDGDEWRDQSEQLDLLTKRFFRPEMKDFYFIDADKAVEFVGGPEGRHSDQMMRQSTTLAVRSLLGLDAMLKVCARLEDRQLSFSRAAGRQSTSLQQQQLAKELEDIQDQLEDARSQLSDAKVEADQACTDFQNAVRSFDAQLDSLEAFEEINRRYDDVRERLDEKKAAQRDLVTRLAEHIDSDRLFGALMNPVIGRVVQSLQPLKDEGYIPPSELTLLPRLLDRGSCVCGISFEEHPERRAEVERRVREADQSQEQARFLDEILEAARRLGNRALGHGGVSRWDEEGNQLTHELGELDPQVSELVEQLDSLREEREQKASVGSVRELQKHRDELEHAYTTAKDKRDQLEANVDSLQKQARSLGERIRTASVAERRTQKNRNAAQAAEDLRVAVSGAYAAIERDQVEDISEAMNAIFRDVITATADSLYTRVGIRQVPNSQERLYEIFAMEGDRDKPMSLANGAARRAIGVSFVLALAGETGTAVPLVADSLLHAMSGSVKRKIVDYLTAGDRVGQPILFGTRTDLLDEEVKELIKTRSGKQYTLTPQSHAGGDVVRAATEAHYPKQTVLCTCAIDQFCRVCECAGDQERAQQGRLIGPVESEVRA